MNARVLVGHANSRRLEGFLDGHRAVDSLLDSGQVSEADLRSLVACLGGRAAVSLL